MPEETDLPILDPGSLQRGRFTYFPVAPGRLEFAVEVRQALLREKPDVVAQSMGGLVSRAALATPGMDRVERVVLLGRSCRNAFHMGVKLV